MKRGDVYRKAARILEQEPSEYAACGALRMALDNDLAGCPFEPEIVAFSDYFKPKDISHGGYWFGPMCDENNDHRILALCLMACIADDAREPQSHADNLEVQPKEKS